MHTQKYPKHETQTDYLAGPSATKSTFTLSMYLTIFEVIKEIHRFTVSLSTVRSVLIQIQQPICSKATKIKVNTQNQDP